MTEGERFVGSLPRKADFHDRNKRRSYELTRRIAARLIDDPGLVANGRSYLERLVRPDPAQAHAYTLWTAILDQDIRQIVSQMLEDSPRGDLLRDTQPVFTVIAPQDRVDMVEMTGLHIRSAASPDRRA
ncbi:UNVERIFIED_ORG: hypothetical protein M2438_002094 [Methylobacterium sp. SuP10 SLI 274]|uniref:hypothetical protein n=1 Tax=Methylorubrum extorquens TaxID=408 RepID=UPI00209CCEA0|nr:hypothetical protein [Methylorubrum extorquens]MDF9863310.1 hypothetical protein [Methylorubrum pseudosasae]MDH6636919.1 hypothetical protein [Methylobacterium sp. SuP10 SLI 274]MDH6666096.1 hypothetical protein [Methylorubrum zatmanii]MCP1558011.1 hypothetical protein [Methylorubrum extorquens]MDF9791620.1 hypothetical protein [Methylorubrum extorquens]